MKSSKPRATFREVLITQSIAAVVFVLVPLAITFIAPLSQLEFVQTPTGIQATVTRYVLICLNWKTDVVQSVTEVRADITAEKRYRGTVEERRKGQKGISLATGQVALVNSGPEVIVQAAPELAREIATKFESFVAAPSEQPLRFDVYASWGISYVAGGVASAFAALYVFGVAMKILLFPFQLLRSASKASSQQV